MQKYHESVLNMTGTPADGVSVLVSLFNGGVATIYSDNGVTEASNPLTTNSLGYFEFYAADGRYTLTISGPGIETINITDVLLEDPQDGSAMVIDGGTISDSAISGGTVTDSALSNITIDGVAVAGSDIAKYSRLNDADGSSLVGFIQSGAGAVARTGQDKLRETVSVKDFGAVGDGVADDATAFSNAATTGKRVVVPAGTYNLGSNVSTTSNAWDIDPLANFTGSGVLDTERGYWKDVGNGVNIQRFNDRLMVGDGTKHSGNKIQTASETWLTSDIGAYWIERGAQTLSISNYGQFGGVFASRTSDQDLHDYGTAAIGVVGLANNDRTNGEGIAWGGYFEANRQASVPSGQGTTYGIEIAVKNNNNDVTNTPYNRFPGGATVGLWLAGGGDPSYGGASANPATAAIVIGKNANTWNKGIVFDATGITGTDGVTGTGTAISMAKGHVIEWQIAGGSQGATIHSEVTDTTKRSGIRFQNDQAWFTVANSLIGTIEKGAGTAGYLRMISAASGSPPQLKVTSTDADADLLLNPQGAGTVRFGFFTANADAPVTGYVGIKDAAGNFRKLAVIA